MLQQPTHETDLYPVLLDTPDRLTWLEKLFMITDHRYASGGCLLQVDACESPAAKLKTKSSLAVKPPARSSALVGLTSAWIIAAAAAGLLAIGLIMLILSAHTSSG